MKDLTDFLDKYNQIYEIVGDKVVAGDIFLHNYNLTTLPKSIGDLVCVGLHLDNNNLTTLPKSIGDLVCNGIHLQNNNLTYLPESICNLKCKYLYLNDNNLIFLPIINKNIKILSIDHFKDLTNLLHLQDLIELWIGKKFYIKYRLTELLNNIRHQKVMNDMNKILETL